MSIRRWPGRLEFYPRSQKMVHDTPWLNSQHYKVWIKSKVEEPRERSCTLSYNLV